jgi:hypothetical protein
VSGNFFVSKRTLPRRTFLRGAGAAIALPLLDAMVPALAQSAAPKAQRLGFIYMPNGVARNFDGIDFWTPKTAGKNFELSRVLTPLAPYKGVLTAVSGLAQHQADAQNDGANGDHTRATASWLSGARVKRTEGADVENGITADQIAAAALGKDTPLPSIELAIDLNFLSGQCENTLKSTWLSPGPYANETNGSISASRHGEGFIPEGDRKDIEAIGNKYGDHHTGSKDKGGQKRWTPDHIPANAIIKEAQTNKQTSC